MGVSSRRLYVLGFVASVLVFGGAAAFVLMSGSGRKAPESSIRRTPLDTRANVVLIVLDTLRADKLESMVNLSRFADKSWRFTNCVSPASWTKPSMVSLFTGVFPQVHNVQWGIDQKLADGQDATVDILPDSIETMAELFKAAKYKTRAIQSNANLQEHFGVSQGFDDYEFLGYPGKRGKDITAAAIGAVRELSSDAFFLYVHYMDAHQPYDPPDKLTSKALRGFRPSPSDLAIVESFTPYYVERVLHDVGVNPSPPVPTLSDEGKRYVVELYDMTVNYLDEQVAELLGAIHELPRDTVVIVLADHGEELWEHGSIGHGKTLFNEVVRVPLLVHVPGAQPARCDLPVQTLDVLPTLAHLVGLVEKPYWQGVNLQDAVDGRNQARALFTETKASIKIANVDLQSAFDGHYKCIWDRRAGAWSLYDLVADPGELVNIASQEPERMGVFKNHLDAHFRACEQNALSSAIGVERPLDQQEIERLESQGYLAKD